MWWFRNQPLRLAGLSALLCVAGCFQPVYSPLDGHNLQAEMASIAISPIGDRLGHYLATELDFAFRGGGSDVPPRYRLEIALRERVQTPFVDTTLGRASAG